MKTVARLIARLLGLKARVFGDSVTVKGELSFKVYDGVVSDETLKYESPVYRNLVTTAGKNYFLLCTQTSGRPTVISGFLIGNGSTTPNVADTNLSGASKYRQAFDSVTTSGNVTTYVITVAAGNATFTHNEFGLTNATTTALSDGVLITHLLAGPYTKASTDVIVYTYTLQQN